MPDEAKTVLVLGGRGFIGGFIVSALRRRAWHVRVLVRPAKCTLATDEIPGDFTRMLTPDAWSPLLDGISVVVNAAGILRETRQQTFNNVHYRAPLALAQACAARGIRFVQISALGHPKDGDFIASKHRFDEALLALPIEAVVLRPSVVYSHRGSYGGTSLLRALAAFPGRQLLPGNGRWTFQPLAAEDLAAVVAAACTGSKRGVYDIGCAEPISLHHYQSQWRRWLAIPETRALHVPLTLIRLQVRLAQVLGRGPVSRTIWNMLLRGNLTKPGSHARVHDIFGVTVRALADVLADQPSQTQDRWAARLYFLAPWLKWSVITLWLWSGVVGLVTPADDIKALAYGSTLAHLHAVELARGAALLDLALATALALTRNPRPIVLAMLVMATAYLLAFGISLPAAFLAPLGGLAKNVVLVPALAVLWVLVERR